MKKVILIISMMAVSLFANEKTDFNEGDAIGQMEEQMNKFNELNELNELELQMSQQIAGSELNENQKIEKTSEEYIRKAIAKLEKKREN